MPKVFVGTMRAGEGDFDKCCESVGSQQGVDVEQVIISGFSEKEAHNVLWEKWNAVKHEFDMFVKVDADTTLANNRTLQSFWELIQSNPRTTGIQAPLLDFFTDGYINGLNCFSPKVVFTTTKDPLYCDRGVESNHDIVISSQNVPNTLRPAGYHCYLATEKQAFRFGLHRKLKNQTGIISLTMNAFLRTNSKLRGFALVGAHVAESVGRGNVSYDNERFEQAFKAASKRYDELINEICHRPSR